MENKYLPIGSVVRFVVGAATGTAIAGTVYNTAYNNNFLGLQDGVDAIGNLIDGFGNYLRNNILNPDIPLW